MKMPLKSYIKCLTNELPDRLSKMLVSPDREVYRIQLVYYRQQIIPIVHFISISFILLLSGTIAKSDKLVFNIAYAH